MKIHLLIIIKSLSIGTPSTLTDIDLLLCHKEKHKYNDLIQVIIELLRDTDDE